MFTKLIELHEKYSAVKVAKPYNLTDTQGWGMAFCQEWNVRKDDICKLLSVAVEDCDYLKYPTYMPLIIRGTQDG